MNRNKLRYNFLTILIFAGILSGSNLFGQIFVTPASTSNKNQEGAGFYYAIPRNVLKVDVILERNERIKGPYEEYSSKILGIENYVKQDEIVYNILDIIISSVAEPDPNAWFFVEFDERGSKDARSLVFDLQSNGVLISADDVQHQDQLGNRIQKNFVNESSGKSFQYFAERNLYQRVDTIIRKITIDTTVIRRNVLQSAWVDRNPEQKARAAADYIHKIRESRFNLISGFQEVNYGTSITYMDRQLQILENEYLSLFLGKEIKTIVEQTVYFYPDKETKGIQTIARLSESSGLVEGNVKGEPLQIIFEPLSFTQTIADENKSIGKTRLSNNIYYRVPDAADISVMFKGKVWIKERLTFSQLGVLSIAPVNKTRLIFDPESGMITTVKRE